VPMYSQDIKFHEVRVKGSFELLDIDAQIQTQQRRVSLSSLLAYEILLEINAAMKQASQRKSLEDLKDYFLLTVDSPASPPTLKMVQMKVSTFHGVLIDTVVRMVPSPEAMKSLGLRDFCTAIHQGNGKGLIHAKWVDKHSKPMVLTAVVVEQILFPFNPGIPALYSAFPDSTLVKILRNMEVLIGL
ncbi:hypothetical protein STEG23_030873, partial [Scotinomys teguina]